jgi:hypothetical protein
MGRAPGRTSCGGTRRTLPQPPMTKTLNPEEHNQSIYRWALDSISSTETERVV